MARPVFFSFHNRSIRMESGEVDPPEDEYPAPTVCKQCGKNPPAPCYIICAECDAVNKKRRLCLLEPGGCIRYSETRAPTTRQKNYMTKGVKQERSTAAAGRDEELHYTEQNTRTQYHGDNYNDE
jgi:hypothetical protein